MFKIFYINMSHHMPRLSYLVEGISANSYCGFGFEPSQRIKYYLTYKRQNGRVTVVLT